FYSPFTMPGRTAGVDENIRRAWVRKSGGLWTANSPHMLFELFELIDRVGLGALIVELLRGRPGLSANKCTLRRGPARASPRGGLGGGRFRGESVGRSNLWLCLPDCGTGADAPGMDIVPRRIDHVLASDEDSQFDWSLSDGAVERAAAPTPIVRPHF